MTDLIILSEMVFFGYHGVNKAERDLGQTLIVDLELELDLNLPGMTDRLADTVNYSEVYVLIGEIVQGPSYFLLERVAEEIAQSILAKFPVNGVRVRVAKPDVPIEGSVIGSAAVDIRRIRKTNKHT